MSGPASTEPFIALWFGCAGIQFVGFGLLTHTLINPKTGGHDSH